MKTLIFLMSATVLAIAADNASLSGKWQIHNNIAGNESDHACTFTQKNSDLTGECSSDKGTVKITGKVDGKKVTWTYKSDYNGSPLTVNYEGTVSSENKISGSVSVPEFSADGDFTATPSK